MLSSVNSRKRRSVRCSKRFEVVNNYPKRNFLQEVKTTVQTTQSVRTSVNASELEAKVAQLQEECSVLRGKNEELRDKAYKALDAVAQSEKTTSQLVQDTKVCEGFFFIAFFA